MKKFLSLFLSAVMAFTLVVSTAWAGQLQYAGKTVILHSNDVHGSISGYAYMAALRDEYKDKGADVILADAGDYSQGKTYVSTTKGEDAFDMMNAVGYDVATIGNHEFDYGWAQLKSNASKATFKILCADVLENGATIFDPYTIIEKDGVKIGFFGMETPEAQTKANPALIKGLTFLAEQKMYDCAQAQVNALKTAGADVIICLSHLGVDAESEPNTSYDLLKNTTGIDMVIDGHSHSVMDKGDNNEPIQSTGTAFANIGVIVIDNATKEIEDNFLYELPGELTADTDVDAVAQAIINRVNQEYGEVFAKSEVELNGDKAPNGNRDSETNLGDLITDAMLWAATKEEGSITVPAENVVAITNGGGIRAWIHTGDVTKNDINTVLPFGNTVAVVYVTGSELLEALEASTYCTPTSIGGFPQVSGVEFTIHTAREYDANEETYPASTYYGPKTINRVTIDSINGQDFDPEATYAVVTNNFCAAGGDTYYAFAAASSQFDTGMPLDEAVMSYVNEVLDGVIGEEYAKPQGRIFVCDATEEGVVKGAVAPTCTKEGYTGDMVCPVCGRILEKGTAIAATGHTSKDGKCTVCGADLKPANEAPATGDSFTVVYMGLAVAALMGTAVVVSKKKEWF
ncbi:MAG: bifunctional UDP-sugar hydrolase/5'-nucleotidase [Eubacteriales bacterium]|nr:bifunctional UDP-sugar hydrolase/5'-nucleotidase [Eubacteriales bacterium]